ncbi:HD domain-containing protein [Neptunicella sp.]|uniref:HD domain-containing protein n=1 Tax=Neptunicella sp. TaxID=2125986 RepID=UPI003F68DEA8
MRALKIESMQPLLVDVPEYKRFSGRYFLTGLVTKPDQAGNPVTVLTVSDATSDFRVFCTSPVLLDCNLQPNTMVHVEAALYQNMGAAYFRCKDLQPITTCLSLGRDLSALPRSLCPKPVAFDALIIFVSRIQNPLLQQFVQEVILQPQIGLRYIQCPASKNFHHNYAGGLIEHSVEAAWNIAGIMDLTPLERDIAVTAALLHDIGKTQTLTPDLTRTAIGQLVDHSHLTLEICANPLRTLALSAPTIANQLRHAWTCHSPRARFGFKPRTRVAKFLQKVDKQSADGFCGDGFIPAFCNTAEVLRTQATN